LPAAETLLLANLSKDALEASSRLSAVHRPVDRYLDFFTTPFSKILLRRGDRTPISLCVLNGPLADRVRAHPP
jgi:hypothetical protein